MRSIPALVLWSGDLLICALLLAATNVGGGEPANTAAPQTPLATKPPPAATPSRLTAAEARELVAFHDAARHEVGVGPVEWSPEVAAFAQQWAEHLAATGKFEHRPYASAPTTEAALQPPQADSSTDLPKQIYGENLAISNSPNYSPTEGARGWYAEKKDYEPGTPIPTDFSKFNAGHYTQMVWSKSTKIGAGKAVIQTGDFAGWTVIVCNYDPPGNWEGVPPFEAIQKKE